MARRRGVCGEHPHCTASTAFGIGVGVRGASLLLYIFGCVVQDRQQFRFHEGTATMEEDGDGLVGEPAAEARALAK